MTTPTVTTPTVTTPTMTTHPGNRLAGQASAYLRQHAQNPVAWWPWCPEALEQARSRNVPLLVSAGYAACHWCHVMEREAFSDPRVAELLNRHFVPIKVDREERPDLDHLAIQALIALGQPAGWPANVFLTPDGRPFAGGTYFPPTWRDGTPGFHDLLQTLHQAWQTGRAGLERTAAEAMGRLRASPGAGARPGWETRALTELRAASHTPGEAAYRAGWGGDQRFPLAPSVELLLRAGLTGESGSLTDAGRVLDAMARGALHDHVAGGFHRYCVDDAWEVPHFEKMLADNAQLLALYARAHGVFPGAGFDGVAAGVVRWLEAELLNPDGTLGASQDADADGEEGAHVAWGWEELGRVLGDVDRATLGRRFVLGRHGNHPAGNVLRLRPEAPLGSVTDGPLLERLRSARLARPRPFTDPKVVVAWNGLALTGLAEAGRLVGLPTLERARTLARRLLDLRDADGLLPRVPGGGRGLLDDHAFVAEGLVALHAATGEPGWLAAAAALTSATVRAFERDGAWVRSVADDLPEAVRDAVADDPTEGAEPSGGSRLAHVLLDLAALGHPAGRTDLVDRELERVGHRVERGHAGWPGWAGVAWRRRRSGVAVVVSAASPAHATAGELARVVNERWRPEVTLAWSTGDPSLHDFQAVHSRGPSPSGARVYVCRDRTCGLPATTANRLRPQLELDA